MATFNQQNQTVQYQYNADTITLSNVSTRADLTRELHNISAELNRAYSLNTIDDPHGQQAKDALEQATRESEQPSPNKLRVTSFLEAAQNAVKGITGLGGLYLAISEAIELAHALF
jgi:hypothetical protein